MSFKRFLTGGVAAAVMMCGAGSAMAAVVIAEFRGTVTTGFGSPSVFGTSDLVGQALTVRYRIDTEIGGFAFVGSPAGVFTVLMDDSVEGSPLRQASIRINGQTDVIDYSIPNFDTQVSYFSNPAGPYGSFGLVAYASRYVPSVVSVNGEGLEYAAISMNAGGPAVMPFDLSDGWSPSSVMAGGNFAHQVGIPGGGFEYAYSFTASFTNARIFEVAAGVPEPATWALMIGGFGLAGGALRRRRATA